MAIRLCTIHEIEDPGSKGFDIEHASQALKVFVVHKDGRFYAYVNRCPHTGINLDWVPDQFLDLDNAFIQCATHNAIFQIEDGLCVAGPCVNQSLSSAEIKLENETIYFIRLT